jgi:aspartyl-tRNA synthetase
MANAPVTLCGWLQHIRWMGQQLCFLTLRDHSGTVQVVVRDQAWLKRIQRMSSLQLESVLCIQGKVHVRPGKNANEVRYSGEFSI